jgi:hypothetical protein
MMTRAPAIGLLACAVGAATVYACSSTPSASPPPVTEAGPQPDGNNGGDTNTPPVDGTSPTEAGDSGPPPPLCSSLPGTILYIESGDTQETILDILGRELRDSANITLVFLLTGSCSIVPAVYAGTPIPANTDMLYIPSKAENPNWTSAMPEYTCVTSPTATTPMNLGISALFPSSCGGTAPAGIGTFVGPIQAYSFVVPSSEFMGGQTSISAEEAYYAMGDGANNPVTWNGNPEWNIPEQFYLRPATKSTLVSTAFNIGLSAAEMTLAIADGGTSDGRQLLASSGDVVTAVGAATSPQAIGILGSEVYDSSTTRNNGINELAFAGFGQTTRYYPDSTVTSFDKQNLRNGNYSLWSPAVILAPVTGGVPTNPAVAYFVDAFLGNPGAVPPGGFVDGGETIDGLGATVSAGLTPDCAMQVQRSYDGAPLTPYTPTAPCTCYYLSKVPSPATLPASCTTCTNSSQCPGGSPGCFNGYCESNPPPSVTATAITKTGLVFPTTADGGLAPPNP